MRMVYIVSVSFKKVLALEIKIVLFFLMKKKNDSKYICNFYMCKVTLPPNHQKQIILTPHTSYKILLSFKVFKFIV